jgi:hypothetical protein
MMCKHCSRLVKDKNDAPVVHAFFEVLTRAANRKLQEGGFINSVTADDLDISVEMTGVERGHSPVTGHEGILKILQDLASGK